jgi:hypothetical protein
MNVFKDDDTVNLWGFHHKDSHDRIRTAIRLQGGPALPDYEVFPFDPSDKGWLERHQQLHRDFTAALGQQSTDLEDVDFQDERLKAAWVQLNFFEHRDAELRLGI